MCNDCDHPATQIFNDGRLMCTDCRDEYFFDDERMETENDLNWTLAEYRALYAAAA